MFVVRIRWQYYKKIHNNKKFWKKLQHAQKSHGFPPCIPKVQWIVVTSIMTSSNSKITSEFTHLRVSRGNGGGCQGGLLHTETAKGPFWAMPATPFKKSPLGPTLSHRPITDPKLASCQIRARKHRQTNQQSHLILYIVCFKLLT